MPMTYAVPSNPTVFISYAHEDADFANQLIADLRANGQSMRGGGSQRMVIG